MIDSPEIMARVSMDERLRAVRDGLDISCDLETPAVKLILETIADCRRQALSDLATVSPTDVGAISHAQAIVRVVQDIHDALSAKIENGQLAEAMLRDEQQMHKGSFDV